MMFGQKKKSGISVQKIPYHISDDWGRLMLALGPQTLVIYLFIFGCFGSSLLHAGLSLVAASRGYSLLRWVGFSLRSLLLLLSTGSRHVGFSSCGTQAQQLRLVGFRAQAQWLWCTGLVAPRHVGSSQTRARTHVPCNGRWILNHCATREVPRPWFLTPFLQKKKYYLWNFWF